jgi:hypothetical protein
MDVSVELEKQKYSCGIKKENQGFETKVYQCQVLHT